MRQLLLSGLSGFLVILVGCNSQHGEHGEKQKDSHAGHDMEQHKSMLMLQTEPTTVTTGQPTKLKMMIHGADGKMVNNFAVVHEQKIHLIIVRDGLDRFDHIHPDIETAGNIATTYTFPTGGTYRLYADYQPVGGSAAVAMTELKVAGNAPPIPALHPDVPGKVKGDGLDAIVSIDRTKTSGEITIRFEITDPAGTPVKDLQPYMGAMGHLVVLSQDGKQFVHAHPIDEKTPGRNVVAFSTHFAQPGLYKGWGQFKRNNRVHVMPFVLRVNE